MKRIFVFVCLISLVLFSSCGLLFNTKLADKTVKKSSNKSIPREYWGRWQRMDNGDFYYIDSDYVYKETSSAYGKNSKIIFHNGKDFGMEDYVFDGDNILFKKNETSKGTETEFLLFRIGGNAKNFTATISGFGNNNTSGNMRAAVNIEGIKGKRTNQNNSQDTQEVTPDSNGKITFTDAVAGDTQEISITGGDVKQSTTIDIIPEYDGQNIGSIPIVNANEYGFKATCSKTVIYAGTGYGLNITMTNIGDRDCAYGKCEAKVFDPKATITGTTEALFPTIKSGDSKTLDLMFEYETIEEEYVDVPIYITMSDSVSSKTWNDCVTIRVLRGNVTMNVALANITENKLNELNGFLIYPNGKAEHFTFTSTKKTISFPWSTQDYIIVFSGATTETELFYSFCINGDPENLSEAKTNTNTEHWFSVMKAYEPNDSLSKAGKVIDASQPVTAYLGAKDLDFYTFNVSNLSCN